MSCSGLTSSALPGLTLHIQAQGKIDDCLGGGQEVVGTFFYAEYPRMHPYAWGDVYQSIQGTLAFGGTATVQLDRSGDLLGGINLRWDLPAWTENTNVANTFDASSTANGYAYTNAIGYYAIERAELKVGGVDVDRLTGDTLYFMDHYLRHERKQAGKLVGDYPTFLDRMEAARFLQHIVVPLTFGCTRPDRTQHWIPTQAVFKQRAELRLCMRPLNQLIHTEGAATMAYDAGLVSAVDPDAILPNGNGGNTMQNAHLQLFIVLLSQNERDMLLEPTTFNISQWHTQGPTHHLRAGVSEDTQRISVNNAVEAVVMFPRLRAKWNLVLGSPTARGYEWTDFSGVDVDMTGPLPGTPIPSARPPLERVRLTLNSAERFHNDWQTFTHFHPWHGGIRSPGLGIGVHQFALKLDTVYPSGHLNASMVDHYDLGFYKNLSTEIPNAINADMFIEVHHLIRNVIESAEGVYRPVFSA